jgi:hypothetical protein
MIACLDQMVDVDPVAIDAIFLERTVGHIAFPPPPFPLTASFLNAELHSASIYRSEHGGLLPNNEFWRYLEARWAANPGRFDHWHPRISPLIAADYRLRHEPQTITPPIIVPTTDPPPVEILPLVNPPPSETPPPGGGDPPPPPINSGGATPEPSSWILLGTSVVAAFLVSKFRRG